MQIFVIVWTWFFLIFKKYKYRQNDAIIAYKYSLQKMGYRSDYFYCRMLRITSGEFFWEKFLGTGQGQEVRFDFFINTKYACIHTCLYNLDSSFNYV